ncbi:hypothetical protein IJF86_00010 [Candidatus Saccharibacteria bacterium]|nr:hypothetical protein [Candidatus Saccharibacteria bacterium]
MKKIFLTILMSGVMAFSFLAPVMALDSDFSPVCSDSNIDESVRRAAGCFDTGTVEGKVNTIYEVILGIAGLAAVVVIIVCGVMMTTSAGDPGKVAKAKKGLLYSVVGLIICLLSWAIVKFILSSVF